VKALENIVHTWLIRGYVVMILPQVHLRNGELKLLWKEVTTGDKHDLMMID